mmetsp:Transcript_110800/g.345325  ORF Transcript_110800/g.345325 Transcript_110800/m.345325 type:complete len:163 (+) Transcript_110800:297-785(+)
MSSPAAALRLAAGTGASMASPPSPHHPLRPPASPGTRACARKRPLGMAPSRAAAARLGLSLSLGLASVAAAADDDSGDGEDSGFSKTGLAIILGAVVVALVGGWQGFRWLTGPKRTPSPLLGDTELGEGEPVTSMWAGAGPGQARQVISQQPAPSSEGFTQF